MLPENLTLGRSVTCKRTISLRIFCHLPSGSIEILINDKAPVCGKGGTTACDNWKVKRQTPLPGRLHR